MSKMNKMLISLMIVFNIYIVVSSDGGDGDGDGNGDGDTPPPERTPENTASEEEQRLFTIEELKNGLGATESEIEDFLNAVTNDNKPLFDDYYDDDDDDNDEIYTRRRRMRHESEEAAQDCRDRIEFTIKFKEPTKGTGKKGKGKGKDHGKPSKHYQQCVENFGGTYFVVEPDCENEDNLFKVFSRDDGQSSFSVFGRNHFKNPKQHHHHHHHKHHKHNHDNIDDEYYWMLLDTSDDHKGNHENMLYYGDEGYSLNDTLMLNSIKPDFDCSTDYAQLFNANHHFKDCEIESFIGCYVECPTCFHDSITMTGAKYEHPQWSNQLKYPPSMFNNWNGEYKRAIYNPRDRDVPSFYNWNGQDRYGADTYMYTKWTEDLSVGHTFAILFAHPNDYTGYPMIAGTDGTLKIFTRWYYRRGRWYYRFNTYNRRSYGAPTCSSIDHYFNRYRGRSATWYDYRRRTYTHVFEDIKFNDCPNVDFQCSA